MKKMNLKSASIGFIAGALFFSGISYAAGGSSLRIVQNGIDKTPIQEDLKPIIYNGRVLVPVRTAANLLGVKVDWDNATKTITLGEPIKGKVVKSVASFDGQIRRITYGDAVTINGQNYGAPSIIFIRSEPGDGEFKINLDAKYKKFTFTLGMSDSSDKNSSVEFTFKDENGKILKQTSIGYGGMDDPITIDVTNVVQLVVETNSHNSYLVDSMTALINPVLE